MFSFFGLRACAYCMCVYNLLEPIGLHCVKTGHVEPLLASGGSPWWQNIFRPPLPSHNQHTVLDKVTLLPFDMVINVLYKNYFYYL